MSNGTFKQRRGLGSFRDNTKRNYPKEHAQQLTVGQRIDPFPQHTTAIKDPTTTTATTDPGLNGDLNKGGNFTGDLSNNEYSVGGVDYNMGGSLGGDESYWDAGQQPGVNYNEHPGTHPGFDPMVDMFGGTREEDGGLSYETPGSFFKGMMKIMLSPISPLKTAKSLKDALEGKYDPETSFLGEGLAAPTGETYAEHLSETGFTQEADLFQQYMDTGLSGFESGTRAMEDVETAISSGTELGLEALDFGEYDQGTVEATQAANVSGVAEDTFEAFHQADVYNAPAAVSAPAYTAPAAAPAFDEWDPSTWGGGGDYGGYDDYSFGGDYGGQGYDISDFDAGSYGDFWG